MKTRRAYPPTHLALLAYLIGFCFTGSAPAQEAEGLDIPEWMSVDRAEKTVALDIAAGKTDANNHWNYNGLTNGEATIVVPEGYTVVIYFTNEDPNMMHSLAVLEPQETYPPAFEEPKPVFAGAISSNPTDMATATQPGGGEMITFIADKAGEYVLICLIPAHAVTGMWIGFSVSAEGKVGLVAEDM